MAGNKGKSHRITPGEEKSGLLVTQKHLNEKTILSNGMAAEGSIKKELQRQGTSSMVGGGKRRAINHVDL